MMTPAQEYYAQKLFHPEPPSGNDCKKCDSKKVYQVGQYIEHCRICDNWQANF